MNELVKQIYRNFKYNATNTVFFEILYKLLAVFLIIPLNYFILNNYIQQTGNEHITNVELVKFVVTQKGLVCILLILVVSFIAIFVEISVLTYMANQSRQQKRVDLQEAIINCIRIIPRKISIYHIIMVLMAGVIGPLTGIGLYNSMIKKLNIPSFIVLALVKSWQGQVLFVAIMLSLYMLLLRWILAIPIIIIEQTTLKQAFKKSISIYKEHKKVLFFGIILWGLVTFVIQAILFIIHLLVGGIVIAGLKNFNVLCNAFISIHLIVFIIGKTLISLVMLPLFITFLVELYYKYGNDVDNHRKFSTLEKYKENKLYQIGMQYKAIFTQVVVAVFAVMIGVMAYTTISDSVINKKINVTAHRGSSKKAPENSLSSIQLAIQEGADYAEIDVMLTKDKEVVLFHDPNLMRISGSNQRIKDMTLEEVKKVDNGSYLSHYYKEERIPTLKEALDLGNGKIKFNIELKVVGDAQELAQQVVDIVKTYNAQDTVIVSSLNYEAIQTFKLELPFTKIGYIMSLGIGDFTYLNVDFVSVEYSLLSKELVHAMNAMGKEVHVWTINTSDRVRDVARLRVDNIITDSVEMVNRELKTLQDVESIDSLTWFYNSVFTLNRYLQI